MPPGRDHQQGSSSSKGFDHCPSCGESAAQNEFQARHSDVLQDKTDAVVAVQSKSDDRDGIAVVVAAHSGVVAPGISRLLFPLHEPMPLLGPEPSSMAL